MSFTFREEITVRDEDSIPVAQIIDATGADVDEADTYSADESYVGEWVHVRGLSFSWSHEFADDFAGWVQFTQADGHEFGASRIEAPLIPLQSNDSRIDRIATDAAIASAGTAGTGEFAVTITVRDGDGNLVPGAKVSIVDQAIRSQSTNNNGWVVFNLSPGEFEVRIADSIGFTHIEDTPFSVVDSSVSVPITLARAELPEAEILGMVNVRCNSGVFNLPTEGTTFTFTILAPGRFVGDVYQSDKSCTRTTDSTGEVLVPVWPDEVLEEQGFDPPLYVVSVDNRDIGEIRVPVGGGILRDLFTKFYVEIE